MHFKILGSGGAQRTPRPCCDCKVCTEARAKGFPYKRLTQSLYLFELKSVFDTPEDICEELNIHSIGSVDNIFYSHFHPDHTMGCRVIEALREDKIPMLSPINVFVPEDGIDISFNNYTPILNLFEKAGYCNLKRSSLPVEINNITIQRVKLNNGFAYGFIIQEGNKRMFYCPCHAMHIPLNLDALRGIDVMLLGVGYINYLSEACTNFKRDILPILKHYSPKHTIFTHIEESDSLSYDDYLEIEEKYKSMNIKFAYDGMEIHL